MVNKTEYFAGKAEALLENTPDANSNDIRAKKANALATLALVHAVNQLNETLNVAQKTDRQQE